MTRRTFLSTPAAALAADGAPAKLPVCAFSKHFQWTTVKEGAKLAAEIGYDGFDLTVRGGGHVLPEKVVDDLPRAVEDSKAAGLLVPMVTTGIMDMKSERAETVIKTMSQLGIKRYRWGGFRYDAGKTIPQQIAEFKSASKDLAAMNRQYGVCAMYHTHSGPGQFGASMWDIWTVLKDLDISAVGVNFDIGHATVEGGLGGWINSTRVIAPMMRGIAFKDLYWAKDKKGKWNPRWCALGQGMVDFKGFLALVKTAGFSGPLQLHMEYEEVGDAHAGKSNLSIPKQEFVRLCKTDLTTLRGFLKEAGLA